MRCLLVLLCLIPAVALADDHPPGSEIVSGVHVYMNSEKNFTLDFDNSFRLSNGNVYKKSDDGLQFVKDYQATNEPAVDISSLDFASNAQKYVGHKIFLRKIRIFGADLAFALGKIPGGAINFTTRGAPPEILRYVLEHCTSIGTGDDCLADVGGIPLKQDGSTIYLQPLTVHFLAQPSLNAPKPGSMVP